MKKKLSAIIMATLCFATANAQNKIYADNTSCEAGQDVEIAVKMSNDFEVTSWQLNMVLPEGVTVAPDPDDEDYLLVELATTRTTAKKHNTFESSILDGELIVACASTKNNTYATGDGDICYVTLNVASSVAAGTYDVTIKNPVMTNTANESVKPGDYTFQLTVAGSGFDLVDSEPYTHAKSESNVDITYTRTFESTEWQALFIPFAMDWSEWSDKGTVAELTGVDNGVLVWTTLEAGSSTEAGKPYIFKPNAIGTVTFAVSNATLAAASDITPVEIDGYTLSGTYQTKTDMVAINGYALADGNFYRTTDTSKTLKPYRIFLTAPASVPQNAPIRSRIDGQDATGIEGIQNAEFGNDSSAEPIQNDSYNLQGVKVGDSYKGIVIENGKKLIRK